MVIKLPINLLFLVMSGIAGIDTLVSKKVSIPKIGIMMRYRKVSIPGIERY